MIRAVFTHRRVTVEGHAGYAPAGQDIVCAAASALLYALLGVLEEKGAVKEAIIRPGYATIAAGEGGEAALELVRCGFAQLSGRYPDYVRVE